MSCDEIEMSIPERVKDIAENVHPLPPSWWSTYNFVLEQNSPVFWGVLFSSRAKTGRLVPVPLISSAREYRTWDDLDTAKWIPRFPPFGSIVNTDIGRKMLEMTYLIYYYPRSYRDALRKNRALAKEDISFKGDVLVMRVEFDAILEKYVVRNMEVDDIQNAIFYVQRWLLLCYSDISLLTIAIERWIEDASVSCGEYSSLNVKSYCVKDICPLPHRLIKMNSVQELLYPKCPPLLRSGTWTPSSTCTTDHVAPTYPEYCTSMICTLNTSHRRPSCTRGRMTRKYFMALLSADYTLVNVWQENY